MDVGPTATKKNVLEQLLEQGMVLIALDARVQGVKVPTHLRDDPQLRLNLSYRFGLPLSLDAWGVDATLTFGGSSYACHVPWDAIFLMVSHISGQPYLFPDDIPAELLAQTEASLFRQEPKRIPTSGSSSKRPKLTLISSLEACADAKGSEEISPSTPPTRSPARSPVRSSARSPAKPSDENEKPPPPHKPRDRRHLRLIK